MKSALCVQLVIKIENRSGRGIIPSGFIEQVCRLKCRLRGFDGMSEISLGLFRRKYCSAESWQTKPIRSRVQKAYRTRFSEGQICACFSSIPTHSFADSLSPLYIPTNNTSYTSRTTTIPSQTRCRVPP